MSQATSSRRGATSALIVAGALIAYIQQMAPSPLLFSFSASFGIERSDVLQNLSVSIIFPTIIAASLLGGLVERKLGTWNLFVASLAFLSLGAFANYVAATYAVFLCGRAIYGIGFGLLIPFIGSATMKWYSKRQREIMNTLNGLFPFVGTVISFGLAVPLYEALGRSWRRALGIWGFGLVAVGALWLALARREAGDGDAAPACGGSHGGGIYRFVLMKREIRLLGVAFICDFACYSYIAAVLPTFLHEAGHVPETTAGLWAALAFPFVGVFGSALGGMATAAMGRRKPIIALAQIVKFVGISVASLGADISFGVILAGIATFGLGNSMWMPAMYAVPMELEGMDSAKVGAAIAFITAGGFVAGFASPILGGLLTSRVMAVAGHVAGLTWSLFAFGLANLVGFACILPMKETGPAARRARIAHA